jgi:ribosomal protein S26
VQEEADKENERKEQEGSDKRTPFSEQSDDDSDVETWSEYEARQQRSRPHPPSAAADKSSSGTAYAAKERVDDTNFDSQRNLDEEGPSTERGTSPPHSPSANTEKSSSVSDTEYGARESDFDSKDDEDPEIVNCDEERVDMVKELEGQRSRSRSPSFETEQAVSDTKYAAPTDGDDPEIVHWDEAMEFLQQALNREVTKSNSLNAQLLQTIHRLQQVEEEKLQVDQECLRLREERREATTMKELAEQELAEQELAEQELAEQELAEQELAEQELAEQELAEQELARAGAKMGKALQIKAAAEKLMEDVRSDRLQVTAKEKEFQEKKDEAERERRKYQDLCQAKLAEQAEAQQDSENSMIPASDSPIDWETGTSANQKNITTPNEPPNPRKRKVPTAPPKRNRKQKKADPPKHKHLPCTECGKHYISPSSETINNKLKQKYQMQLILSHDLSTDGTFFSKYVLDRHMASKHEKQIPVQCEICHKLLCRADSLTRHMEKIHGQPSSTSESGEDDSSSNEHSA